MHVLLHFHFNKMQMNTIVADLKSWKYTNVVLNQHNMHRAHQSHYFYCLKTSRIGSVHSGNISWVSDQFHNAHGSALTELLDVHTARISRMQGNWNTCSYRPHWLCKSLKYREMNSIIERMVLRWSKNTELLFFLGGGGKYTIFKKGCGFKKRMRVQTINWCLFLFGLRSLLLFLLHKWASNLQSRCSF